MTSYSSFMLRNVKFRVEECVMIKSSQDDRTESFIGKITGIEMDDSQQVVLSVRWYYRPEETADGRQSFHGKNEVFSSNHFDRVMVETVDSKAAVLSLAEYQKPETEDQIRKLQIPSYNVFYVRCHYDAKTKKFHPPLPVHCLCRTPDNPDRLMIGCDDCDEWFHAECVGLTREEADALSSYTCDACADKAAGKAAKRRKDGSDDDDSDGDDL